MSTAPMSTSVAQARRYVQEASLPAALPGVLAGGPALDFAFDAAKEQASVVGSDVVAFVKGITAEQRSDLVNATLLAQLVAKKAIPEPENLAEVLAWYDKYFEVLENVGFVVQDKGFAKYEEKADSFEAHEAIIDVAKVLLAGAPGALAVVVKTLESLRKMSADSPWITIFHRETRSAKTGRFQVTIAEPDGPTGLLVTLMAFGVEANSTMTQVLFFKFTKNQATLQHQSGKVTINSEVLGSVRAPIAEKIKAHTAAFVAGLDV